MWRIVLEWKKAYRRKATLFTIVVRWLTVVLTIDATCTS